MSISDTENNKLQAAKIGFVYLLVSMFCALFGAVYECFSHEVYSFYMIYAFAFPLVGGVLPFYSLFLCKRQMPGRLVLNLYHSGIAAFTVGSFMEGVFEIYGTTNRLTSLYWYLGTFSMAAVIMVCMWKRYWNLKSN